MLSQMLSVGYPICDNYRITNCNTIVSTFDATLRQRLIELYPVHPSTAHLWKLLNDDTLHSRFQLIDKLICTHDDSTLNFDSE